MRIHYLHCLLHSQQCNEVLAGLAARAGRQVQHEPFRFLDVGANIGACTVAPAEPAAYPAA